MKREKRPGFRKFKSRGVKKDKALERHADWRCKYNKKIIYNDEASAKIAAKNFRKKYGPKLVVYECQAIDSRIAQHWHVGHDRPLKRRITAQQKRQAKSV